MPVRVSKLGSVIPASNVQTTLFTVPAGFTYLVKDVIIVNTSGVADTASAWAQDAGGTRGATIYNASLASGGRTELQTLIAMGPGDTFIVFSNAGPSSFWVSGTKLPGVA